MADAKGIYVPNNYVWDVAQVGEVDVNSEEFKELLVRLYQNINNITIALNLKESGYYLDAEFINSQLFYPNPALTSSYQDYSKFRNVFRKVIIFGALPAAGTKSVPHGIPVNAAYTFTRIYGVANNQTGMSYLPLPYASPTLANNIELNVDGTNINITVGTDRSAYTITNIIVEYMKN